MRTKFSELRKEYNLNELDELTINKNPIEQLSKWVDEAINAKLHEPYAMNLATVNKFGRPSSRIVLLKNLDMKGLIFFTNYNSRKGENLSDQPFAALNFYWGELERQVRVEGRVSKISDQESDEYFNSRPIGSKIGALASPQSEEIPSRVFLEKKQAELEEKFKSQKITRPENWGGYILKPDYVEFWQGRANRLHDRIAFEIQKDGWRIFRLAP